MTNNFKVTLPSSLTIIMLGIHLSASIALADAAQPQPYIPPPSFLQLNKLELISQHKETFTAKDDGFYEFRSEENKLLAKHKHPYFDFNFSYEKRQVDPQKNKANFTTTSSGINGHSYQLNIGKLNRKGGNKINFYSGYGLTAQYNDFKILTAHNKGGSTNNKVQALYGGFYMQIALLSTFNKKLYGNTQLYLAGLVGQNKYTIQTVKIPITKTTPKKLSYSAQAGLLFDQEIKTLYLLTLALKGRINVAGIYYQQFLVDFKTEKIQLVCNGNARLAFKFNLSPRFYYSIAPGYQYDCPNKLKYEVLPTAGAALPTSITATKKADTGFMLTSEIVLLESVLHHNSFRLRYAQTPQTKKGELYYQYRFK